MVRHLNHVQRETNTLQLIQRSLNLSRAGLASYPVALGQVVLKLDQLERIGFTLDVVKVTNHGVRS